MTDFFASPAALVPVLHRWLAREAQRQLPRLKAGTADDHALRTAQLAYHALRQLTYVLAEDETNVTATREIVSWVLRKYDVEEVAAAPYTLWDGISYSLLAGVPWASITNVPATFPPSGHTHPSTAITDFAAAVQAIINAQAAVDEVAMEGDVTGMRNNTHVRRLNGVEIDATSTPANGKVLTYDGTTNKLKYATPAGGGGVTSVNSRTGVVALTAADVDLANVNNTADSAKPVSTLQAAADTVVLNAAKTYADGLVVGLWDDRGSYSADSGNFPTTGGSGASGAVLKGDIWTIVSGGVIGDYIVTINDTLRALTDTPGQTEASWAVGKAPASSFTTFRVINELELTAGGQVYTNNGSETQAAAAAFITANGNGDNVYIYIRGIDGATGFLNPPACHIVYEGAADAYNAGWFTSIQNGTQLTVQDCTGSIDFTSNDRNGDGFELTVTGTLTGYIRFSSSGAAATPVVPPVIRGIIRGFVQGNGTESLPMVVYLENGHISPPAGLEADYTVLQGENVTYYLRNFSFTGKVDPGVTVVYLDDYHCTQELPGGNIITQPAGGNNSINYANPVVTKNRIDTAGTNNSIGAGAEFVVELSLNTISGGTENGIGNNADLATINQNSIRDSRECTIGQGAAATVGAGEADGIFRNFITSSYNSHIAPGSGPELGAQYCGITGGYGNTIHVDNAHVQLQNCIDVVVPGGCTRLVLINCTSAVNASLPSSNKTYINNIQV